MSTISALTDEKKGISWTDWIKRNRLQDLRGVALRATLTEAAAIAVLLLGIVFWSRAADYRVWLGLVVCAGAIRVAFLAGAVRRYDWASLFIAIAFLYNPVLPPFALAGRMAFLLAMATIAAFTSSMFQLKPRLTPSVAGFPE